MSSLLPLGRLRHRIAGTSSGRDEDTIMAGDGMLSSSSSVTPLLDNITDAANAEAAMPGSGGVNASSVHVMANDRDDEDILPPAGGDRHPGRHLLCLMAAPVTDDRGRYQAVVAGIATVCAGGVLLGLVLPKNPELPAGYRVVSACVGYSYFWAWSVSFYPQVLTNYRRQTTEGLSVDFVCLNLLGFLTYSVYNGSLYWNPTIHKLYHERYGDDAQISVEPNDVLFAFHALAITLVVLSQIVYYDGGVRAAQQRLSQSVKLVMGFITAAAALYPLLIMVAGPLVHTTWLDYLYVLSGVKIVVTLMKYVPQVILNHQRQSTQGWSVWQVLLDLTGGLLSVLQLVLDCAAVHDFSGITGNLAKFCLGLVSIVFDVVFIMQHYVLYPDMAPVVPGHDDDRPERDGMTPLTVGDESPQGVQAANVAHATR